MTSSDSHPSFSPERGVIGVLAGENSSAAKDDMFPDKSKWKVEQKGVWEALVNHLLNSIYKDCCPVLTFWARIFVDLEQLCLHCRADVLQFEIFLLSFCVLYPSCSPDLIWEETWAHTGGEARLYRLLKTTRVPWSWRSGDPAVSCLPQHTYCIMLMTATSSTWIELERRKNARNLVGYKVSEFKFQCFCVWPQSDNNF